MENLTTIFGSDVFTDDVMRERLPREIYDELISVIDTGTRLTLDIADVVANAMKDWATEKGATHYTHWFQPMTGNTAEKHDSFISPQGIGEITLSFSGKELIQGEPDASSFPNGGLRQTAEARGYTAWDCTSPAFVKDGTLYLPTAFCSYTGFALDKKTPLLRSMDALSKQAMRVLKVFGNKSTKKVISFVGAEQEYFLIDKRFHDRRKDLMFTGRTLFGAPAPKGQEMDDQYFGSLKERVSEFMKEFDTQLWKLGVTSTTKHNEVAPAQHEMAPVYSTTNIATDHNQLVMETAKKVALRQGLVCLLHEKPFAGFNGSGKHINWSLATDDGINLIDPGDTPHENAQFLVFLSAVIWAVDEYAELLRCSAANPGNDHRLGANEAPPGIISIFLGDLLTKVIDSIVNSSSMDSTDYGVIKIGASTMPHLPKDTTDRNRTSPFAFTGNKFEFRMVGSSQSISGPIFVINTIVAEILERIAEKLENASDLNAAVQDLVKQVWKDHGKVVFNGNGYANDWVKEAEERGLPNIDNTVDAIKVIAQKKSIQLFENQKVLSEAEMFAREEVLLEHYINTINIEAQAMLEIANREILPSGIKYAQVVAKSINEITATGIKADTTAQADVLLELSTLNAKCKTAIKELQLAVDNAASKDKVCTRAEAFRDDVFVKMGTLRLIADQMEVICDDDIWPLPSYGDLLFRI
ncbi:MAG: glutamine synthetase III [Clostridiales bacterium]|nr:glutamine synthetase III [Clostridiales bacterium]